ncbi:MAG: hypothetical protein U5J98_02355 [Halobacteriales archaeon]|nr:hypothetical protein [Halobacteriales archaeon]
MSDESSPTETQPMTDDTPADDTANRLLDDPAEAKRYLLWAAVALLALLAVVATFRVYTSTSQAIGRFVAYEYRALFQAAFNLAVLLLAVAGITSLLRRLQAGA